MIPFAIGLLDGAGDAIPLSLEGDTAAPAQTRILHFQESEQRFVFSEIPERPIPSLLRDFSAPVKIDYPYSEQEYTTLIAHDSDPFARWEAAQRFAQVCILTELERRANGQEMSLNPALASAFRGLLEDRGADPALLAEALILPAEDYLAEQMETVDVDGIHAAREFVRQALAGSLETQLHERYRELDDGLAYEKAPAAMARRSLKNVCLSYLATTAPGSEMAERQLSRSDNMTDTLAAMNALVQNDLPGAGRALAEFERRWSGDALVMDKWFSMQARKPGHEAVERVQDLMGHPEFSLLNPNKVRALIGVFAVINQTGFHEPGGAGLGTVSWRTR